MAKYQLITANTLKDVYTLYTSNYAITAGTPYPSFVRITGEQTIYHGSDGRTIHMDNPFVSTDFCIKSIKILPSEENPCVTLVEFEDGSIEKAVKDKDDTFNLEIGLSICLMKKLLATITGSKNGTKLYNDAIKNALRRYEEIKKERREEEERKAIAERRKQKKIAKKRKRAEQRRRQNIADQKEAYVQAMREIEHNWCDDGR